MYREKQTSSKRENVKKGITLEDSRKKREDNFTEIRKNKRDDNLQKRRNFGTQPENEKREFMHSESTESTPPQSNQPVVYDEAVQRELALLPEYHAALHKNDLDAQLQATIQIRKMLSVEKNPPIDYVIQSGIVPRVMQLLTTSTHPKLVFEVSWVITNIASGNSEQTRYLVELGAVQAFSHILVHSTDDDLKEQAIWALGNIAGDSPQCRDFVISHGIMAPLLHALQNPSSKVSMMRNATWTLSNLCRGRPAPNFSLVSPALPLLNTLIRSSDVEVMIDACWALSYLSDGSNDNIQAVLDCGCASRMVSLLNHPSYKIQVPALRTVGNIITGSEKQTQILLDLNVLPLLYRLLQSPRKGLRKESCWAISNIVAGSSKHTQFVITCNVIPMIVKILRTADLDIKKEAAHIMCNATSWKIPEQIRYLTGNDCIAPLCDLLTVPDAKLVMVVMDALENILAAGENFVKDRLEQNNPYTSMIEEAEGLDKLEKLQEHENQQIYEKAVKLLETYFDAGAEDENLAPQVSANQQTYTFAAPSTMQVPANGFAF